MKVFVMIGLSVSGILERFCAGAGGLSGLLQMLLDNNQIGLMSIIPLALTSLRGGWKNGSSGHLRITKAQTIFQASAY